MQALRVSNLSIRHMGQGAQHYMTHKPSCCLHHVNTVYMGLFSEE